MSRPTPLTEDAINRYRILHSDKEIRPLARRLHRYAASSALGSEPDESDRERDMIRLEGLKWKLGVERMLGSVKNMERQRTTYQSRAAATVDKTGTLSQTLEEEKVLLETRRRERDRMIKCDEIAAKITSRGKTRQELDERIATLQQSLEEHKAALKVYQETAQGRVDIFNQISDLVKDCRDLKLPIDPNAAVPIEEEVEKIEVEEKVSSTSSGATVTANGTKLSSMALPFQPGPSSSTSSRPRSSSRRSTPPTSAALPARPPSGPSNSRLPSAPPRGPGSSSLPARPSSLRSSTTGHMNASGSSLEEGELGGDEDGEVKERDRGTKRALEPERSSGRSTRSRK